MRRAGGTSARLSCPITSDCAGVLGRPVIYPFPSKLGPDRGQEIFYPCKTNAGDVCVRSLYLAPSSAASYRDRQRV